MEHSLLAEEAVAVAVAAVDQGAAAVQGPGPHLLHAQAPVPTRAMAPESKRQRVREPAQVFRPEMALELALRMVQEPVQGFPHRTEREAGTGKAVRRPKRYMFPGQD